MKRVLVLLFLLIPAALLGADNNCVSCHLDFEEAGGPAHKFSRDIHAEKGISCADCHGGDASLDDMDDVRAVRGFRGVPSHREVPDFCARCHSDAAYMRNHNPALPTDQLDKFKSSIHGQRLFQSGDSKVANCISCHSVHAIGSGKMPHSSTHPLNLPNTCGNCHANAEYMAEYGISTSQLADFEKSVHGQALLVNKDLGAPACNDCHSNHGAAPPGTESLAAVCGNCHALEAGLFVKSPHADAFAENDFPMCETCHSNHLVEKPSYEMVGSSENAVCVECHTSDDGTIGLETADSMHVAIRTLIGVRQEAEIVLAEAITKGMMTTDEELRMKEVDQAIIHVRTQVHSFNMDSLRPKAEAGIAAADSVKVNSAELIEEYYYRRKGLGLATLFITILAAGLYWKIRKLG